MNAMSEPTHVANDIGTALTIADRNATAGGELAVAAGKVIALRPALGVAGMADPANADHRELARILPEKSEAVAAAGSILLQRSGQVAQQVVDVRDGRDDSRFRRDMAAGGLQQPGSTGNRPTELGLGLGRPRALAVDYPGHDGDALAACGDGPVPSRCDRQRRSAEPVAACPGRGRRWLEASCLTKRNQS